MNRWYWQYVHSFHRILRYSLYLHSVVLNPLVLTISTYCLIELFSTHSTYIAFYLILWWIMDLSSQILINQWTEKISFRQFSNNLSIKTKQIIYQLTEAVWDALCFAGAWVLNINLLCIASTMLQRDSIRLFTTKIVMYLQVWLMMVSRSYKWQTVFKVRNDRLMQCHKTYYWICLKLYK